MPDAFGDKIGMLVDMKMGNMPGAMRNAVDLASGLSTGQMDQLQGMKGNIAFSRAFSPRCHFSGPHLHKFRMTYPMHERVGRQAHLGQKYDTGKRFFGMKIQGRISGKQYMGSFFKPVRLGKSGYLFRGRQYANLGAINKDMRDGRVDGLATRRMTVTGWARTPMMMRMPHMLSSMFTPGLNIASQLGKIFAAGPGLLGGIPQDMMAGGAQGSGGAQGGGGPQAGGGAGSSESVLSNPNLSIEDKLMLLMSKLSDFLDKQIEDKMGELEKATQGGKGAGGAGGKGGGGGIGGMFGSLGKIAGGIAGTAFGGPLGGMLGTQAGGMLGKMLGGIAGGGGAKGGAGGAGGAQGGKKPNIQKLQTELQSLMQKRQQMFQTMQNIMKSMHDSSMAAIRNLKA
ncbi:MAG: hypothetical protein HKN20_12085 [Gemmatimonadetes bacterium]|nr:hypothetical protein [Gemmatimonadota bacterium]